MKTSTKKILLFIACLLIVLSMGISVFASTTDAGSIIDGMNGDPGDTQWLQKLGGSVLTIIQIAGIVIGVIIIAVLGLKYMAGSLEEKAEYKKTMIPWLVGAVLIIAAPSIAKALFALVGSLGNTGG